MHTITVDLYGTFEANSLSFKFNSLNEKEQQIALKGFERPIMLENSIRILLRKHPDLNVVHLDIHGPERKQFFTAYPLNQIEYSDYRIKET